MNIRRSWLWRQARRRVPIAKSRRRYFGKDHKQKKIMSYAGR
jgi:hypothetical protein